MSTALLPSSLHAHVTVLARDTVSSYATGALDEFNVDSCFKRVHKMARVSIEACQQTVVAASSTWSTVTHVAVSLVTSLGYLESVPGAKVYSTPSPYLCVVSSRLCGADHREGAMEPEHLATTLSATVLHHIVHFILG